VGVRAYRARLGERTTLGLNRKGRTVAESAGGKAAANDAAAGTHDDLSERRPATAAEREYLDARVDDCAAAVAKMEGQADALKVSLKTARVHLAEAKASQAAGRDLASVQKGRVA
jgi:hypothetical protein